MEHHHKLLFIWVIIPGLVYDSGIFLERLNLGSHKTAEIGNISNVGIRVFNVQKQRIQQQNEH